MNQNRDDPGQPSDDTMTQVHYAGVRLLPATVAASILTAFHDTSMLVAVLMVIAWAIVGLHTAYYLEHRWDICSRCDQPPRQVATVEARLRLAQRLHSRWTIWSLRIFLTAALVVLLAPKPGSGQWWGRALIGSECLLCAAVIVVAVRALVLHKPHRDECPREWCRAHLTETGSAWQRWVAHYGVWSLPVFVPAQFVLGALALKHHGLERWYPWGFLPALYVAFLMVLYHTNQLCLICATRLPDNGGELAEKRLRWLRSFHENKRFLILVALAEWLMSWTLAGQLGGRVAVAMAGLCITFQLILSRVHGRVRPWCPWCRDDGGGQSADATTPDPSRNAPTPV